MVCYDNGKKSIELLMNSIPVENLIMRPRNAIVAVSWLTYSIIRITEKARYPRLQRVKPRSLLRMRKCTCPGYLQENPFVQNRGNGFFRFQ